MNTYLDILKNKSGARLILLGLLMVLSMSVYSLIEGYKMVGKSFQGFSMEFSFITFPVDSHEWTGSKANFQYYEQIRAVDGKVFANSKAFQAYIQSLPPDKPVKYTLMREGKPVEVSIPTMTFSLKDYFKIFGLNTFLAWLYGALTLFILLRREKIQQSKVILFLTSSFTLVYALRPAYDYLHQFVPLALLGFGAFPLSLLLLGTHLAKPRKGSPVLGWVEKINLGGVGLLSGILALMSLFLAPAPFASGEYLKVFVSLYEVLVSYYLVGILGFVGLLVWGSVRKHQDELKTWQSRIVLFGSVFSFAPYLIMMGAFWVFKLPWALPGELVAANTYLFILFVFYAVLQDEGVALEVFIRKTAFYYILLFVFAMAYTMVYRFVTMTMQASFISEEQIPFIAGLAAFMLVSVFNTRIQDFISRIFYRQHKAINNQLESFIQNSTSTLEPPKLIELGLDFLKTAFGPQQLALYLSPNLGIGPLNLAYQHGGTFPDRLHSTGSLISPAEIQRFRNHQALQQDVILPLYKGSTLLGLFILDKKSSGLGYFAEDRELLKKFAFYFVTGFYIACLSQKTLSAYQKTEATKRMEVLGTLASGVAHDFNNLLSTIIMSVGLLKYLTQDTDVLERLQVIQASAEKGAAITRALSDYASTLPPEEAVSLHEIMQLFESQLRATLPDGIELKINLPSEDDMILADPDQLERALLELSRNAELAMNGEGHLTIDVSHTGRLPGSKDNFEADDQEYLCIRLTDTGEGIPESIRSRIFDPFFSAWTEGRGIGLGLSIARQIVKNHNGRLEFKSWEGEGSSFSIYLPLASHASQSTRLLGIEAAHNEEHQGLILLIDDEAPLRQLLSEALSLKGYRVIEAVNGEEGLALFKAHQDELQLVVCDLEMPRFDGRRFIAEARAISPDQAILVSSGNASKTEQKAFRQQGIQVLHKPYTFEQLLEAIRQTPSRI